MIIAVDIGNSNVVIGLYVEDKWQHIWRIQTHVSEESSMFYDVELRQLLMEDGVKKDMVTGVIMSTVVPDLKEVMKGVLTRIFDQKIEILSPPIYELLNYQVPRPYEIGTDLVANAYAGYRRYKQACIIVDFGTALTFTTVDHKGYIRGVAISPGIKTAMKALSDNTAQLPEIPLELPKTVVGLDTTHAMQAGILWGYVGIVKELVAKIRKEVGEDYIAVATGGLSFIMNPLQGLFHDIDSELTLHGLRYFMEDLRKITPH